MRNSEVVIVYNLPVYKESIASKAATQHTACKLRYCFGNSFWGMRCVNRFSDV